MKIINRDLAKFASLITLLMGSLLISACSSTPPSSTLVAPDGLSATEFHEKMAEFERMQPSLQRLATLEPELKELIAQLTQIAQAAEMQETETVATAKPAVQENSIVDVVNTDTTTVMPETLASEPEIIQQESSSETQVSLEAASQRGPYTLQLTAVTDKSKLRSSWLGLQQRHKPSLADLTAISQQVEVSGVTFYRIKAGFYDSLEDAKKSCEALKQAQANCIVSDNRGEDIL